MQCRLGLWIAASLMGLLGVVALPWQEVWLQPAHTQKEHHHDAPHGGQMATAGKYHLELVVQEHKTVQVYLYDEASKPMTVPTPEATLYLRLPGNKQHALILTAVGGQTATAWAATTDVLRDVSTFDAALRVALDGEARNIRFTYKEAHKGGKPGTPHKH